MSSSPYVPPRPSFIDHKNYHDPTVAEYRRHEKRFAPPRRPNVALEHLERVRAKSMMSTKSSDTASTWNSLETTDSQRSRMRQRMERDSVPQPLLLKSKVYQAPQFAHPPPQLQARPSHLQSQQLSYNTQHEVYQPHQTRNSDSHMGNSLNLHEQFFAYGDRCAKGLKDSHSHHSKSTTQDDIDLKEADHDGRIMSDRILGPRDSMDANPKRLHDIERYRHDSKPNSPIASDNEMRYSYTSTELASDWYEHENNMDVDEQDLPTTNENDGSSLLGRSSITTIRDSPIRYVQGRDVGLPSSSPRLPSAQKDQDCIDYADPVSRSSDIPSSPPISKNRFQDAWDLQEQGGKGWRHIDMDKIRLLRRDDMGYAEGDQVSDVVSSSSEFENSEQSQLPEGEPQRTIVPLSFDDMHKLREAGRVLRKQGREQDYHDFLRAVGVPQSGAVTVGQLLNHHMDAMREQMNEHAPSDHPPSPEMISGASIGSQYPSPPYSILQSPPTSSGDVSSISGQLRSPISFTVPPMPPILAQLRSSGGGKDDTGKGIRKKMSFREGFSKVFLHSKKASSDRGSGHRRSSSEVKPRAIVEETVGLGIGPPMTEEGPRFTQRAPPRVNTAGRLRPTNYGDSSRRDRMLDIVGGMV